MRKISLNVGFAHNFSGRCLFILAAEDLYRDYYSLRIIHTWYHKIADNVETRETFLYKKNIKKFRGPLEQLCTFVAFHFGRFLSHIVSLYNVQYEL